MKTQQKQLVSDVDGGGHKNIFVLGFDEEHSAYLHQISDVERFTFHPLLQTNELVHLKHYDLGDIIDRARRIAGT